MTEPLLTGLLVADTILTVNLFTLLFLAGKRVRHLEEENWRLRFELQNLEKKARP